MVVKLIMKMQAQNESISKVHKDSNGALHIVAFEGDVQKAHSWPIPGDALQLQWEIKWFKVYLY